MSVHHGYGQSHDRLAPMKSRREEHIFAKKEALHGKLGNETERNLTRVKKKWLSLYP